MGRPKSLLDFDGRTGLSLVMEACVRSLARETVLVLGAGDTGRERQEAGSGRPDQPLKVVVNDRFMLGRTSSIKTGLEAISPGSDGFMIVPVDLPLVRSVDIDALISRQEAAPRGRTIFVATWEGQRGHPILFANAHKEHILELRDDEPLRDYVRVRQGETEQVPVDNDGVVASMNTPEEYAHVLAAYRDRAVRGRERDGAAG